MSNSGYVRILHDLLRSDLFLDAPCAYRCVLITLIDRCVFEKHTQDDHGRKITLKPGQYLTTIRKLSMLANVEKNDAERAVKYFSEIVRQEVRHRKSIFTIIWGAIFKSGETGSETKKRQERDTKEEHKNKRQQQPDPLIVEQGNIIYKNGRNNAAAADFLNSLPKKKAKQQDFIDHVVEKHSTCFDASFIRSLIRKHKFKAVTFAMDDYEKSSTKINNPRGFFTDLVKKRYEEFLEDEREFANK